jgi:hypothetical protein
VNAWFRDRARAEALPSFRGSLLDIERGVRLVQFRAAQDDPDLWDPWPMKGLDRLAAAGLVDAEIKTRLQKAYGFQWLAANRLALLGPGGPDDWDALQSGRWDERLGLPDAGPRLVQEIAAARSVLRDLVRE